MSTNDLLKVLEERLEDLGMKGTEYEAHESTKPVPPLSLQIRCYYEARPLYEFLVRLLREFSLASAPIKFDFTIMARYERYLTILCSSTEADSELLITGIKITQCLRIVKRMILGDIPYHNAMESCLKLLNFRSSDGYPSKGINTDDGYQGEDFEELVDMYVDQLVEHRAESNRISAKNIAKQGGGDTE